MEKTRNMKRVQFIKALKAVKAFYTTHDYESSTSKMMELTGWDEEVVEMCYDVLFNDGIESFGNLVYGVMEDMED